MSRKGGSIMFKKPKSSGVTAEIRVRRCYGCGAILQDQDPEEVGYIPPEKFATGEEALCQRCYKLRHYSTMKKTSSIDIDYATILADAKDNEALVVYVLNAFCLTSSLIPSIGKYLSDNVLVVVNKRDILPKNYSEDYIKAYVTKALEKEKIKPLDIILTSSAKEYNIDEIIKEIKAYRNDKSVYFIGAYQVGKSSLINCLLRKYINSTDKMITTSPYPGTTLDVISIPIDDKSYIYDTPGIYNEKSIISFVEPEQVKYIIPRSEIKPEVYQTKDGQSFLFSNLARIDMLSGEKCDITVYKSNDITIDRCKTLKADASFKELAMNKDVVPHTDKVQDIADLDHYDFKVEKEGFYRIRIVGLGFIEFKGIDQEFRIYAPKGVEIFMEETSIDL